MLNPAVVFGTLWLAVTIRGLTFTLRYEVLGIIGCLVCVVIFKGLGYNRSRWRTGTILDLGSLMVAWTATAAVLLLFGYLTKSTAQYSRIALTTWFVLAFFVLCLLHALMWSCFGWLRRRGVGTVPAVIGPWTPVASRLAAAFREDASLGVNLIGYFDDRALPGSHGLPRLGSLWELAAFARRERVGAAYISLEQPSAEALSAVMSELQGSETAVYLIPNLFAFDLLHSQLESVSGIPTLAVGRAQPGELGGLMKRGMDIALSAVALALLSPVLLGAAAAIKLDSDGPVFFRQRRYGMNGDGISVWKLRTMRCMDTDGASARQTVRGDSRVTRAGAWLRRTSVDEIPQLWNVLCGSMSMVGPRPHTIALDECYRDKIRGYLLRRKVRPGVTGWAQVNGHRGETDTVEKMQRRLDFDLEYIRRWSPMLDIWILLRTIPALLTNRDVY
ncbi:MAG: undecaprenyl-phosphate glucose phosphotransferase [Terriglobales bacterium]